MSAIVHVIGDGSSSLPTDPNPNTTAPDTERQFDSPFPSAPCGPATVYMVAKGGTSVSVRLWMYDETIGRWFARGASLSLSSDQLTILGDIPRGVRVTAQITLNLGVTQIGIGYMGIADTLYERQGSSDTSESPASSV
jgi:hypothetical protein